MDFIDTVGAGDPQDNFDGLPGEVTAISSHQQAKLS